MIRIDPFPPWSSLPFLLSNLELFLSMLREKWVRPSHVCWCSREPGHFQDQHQCCIRETQRVDSAVPTPPSRGFASGISPWSSHKTTPWGMMTHFFWLLQQCLQVVWGMLWMSAGEPTSHPKSAIPPPSFYQGPLWKNWCEPYQAVSMECTLTSYLTSWDPKRDTDWLRHVFMPCTLQKLYELLGIKLIRTNI